VSAAVTDGYVQEQQRRTERRERVEAHFFQDLLTGNFDEETILYRAKKVGYDLAQPYATLVIATGAAEEEGRSPASSTAEIVLRVGRARGAIGYIARGHVVLLTRYVNAQTLERFAAEIFEMVQERVGTAVVVSVGLPGTQMREVHQSYLDALDTLNAACQLRKSGIVRREEMIPYRIVAANERLREHLSLVVRPLASYDTKNGLQLIETLEAFFAANQSTRVAAERLHVHRHTVDYRLQKIEALCGRDLHNPVDRLLLELGLLALRSSPTE
jgi:sugar diacid utilization regulator